MMVECSTTLNCSSNSSTLISARECCVDSLDGLAYTIPRSGECHVCVGTHNLGKLTRELHHYKIMCHS